MSRRLVVLLALAVCLTAVYAAPSSAWALAFSGQPLEVGAAPQGVAVGDFNCDGIRDLVTANHDANTVSVLLGNGTGGVAVKADFPTGLNPSSVAVGDFNGDGVSDLITTD